MQIIVITRPDFFPREADEITRLFVAGLEILHLRKPQSHAGALENLLRTIPSEYYSRIVLHEHFDLAERYSLRGVHLNRRNPEAPLAYTGAISRSCHSLEEVQIYKAVCDYVFLSPIYDSISKEGYGAAFSKECLRNAQGNGIIDQQVYALGGITSEHLPEIRSFGFGGAALLGDIWQREPRERLAYLKQILTFQSFEAKK